MSILILGITLTAETTDHTVTKSTTTEGFHSSHETTNAVWTMTYYPTSLSTMENTHTATSDSSLITHQPTGATITPGIQTSIGTVEPPVTAVTSRTVESSIATTHRPVTVPQVPTTTGEYDDACRKSSIPVWNIICELSRTVARRGG